MAGDDRRHHAAHGGVDRSKAKPFIAMTDTRQYADRDIADALGRNTQLFPTMTFTQGRRPT